MPFADYTDFDDCVAKNSGKSNPQAYCASIMRKVEKVRHKDFERIRNEFISYYKNEAKGDREYCSWLNALHLDETLCYAQTHESFTWAKDMISKIREDAENKYYKVLLGFPITSMNGNVYRERDLIAAAMFLKGKSPDMNHKETFWLNPENKYNRWGTVTTEDAKYEDGAVELVMKVPKKTLCPVCNEAGKPLYKLIDEKRIVNVSLNGFNATPEGGFKFNEQIPYTLLTSDVLPGIPLARIFPIESYLPFSSQSSNHSRTIKIVGLENMTKTKQEATECPTGSHLNDNGECVPDEKEPETEAVDAITGADPTVTVPLKKAPPVTDPVGTDVPAAGNAAIFPIPDNSGQRTFLGENAQLKVDKLKAEQKTQSLELQKAEFEAKLTEAYTANAQLRGNLETLKLTVEKLEQQIQRLNTEKIADASEVKSLTHRLEDMTDSRDSYKKDLEATKKAKEDLETKYREQLKTNLALEKKLTDTNEEYLVQAKKAEQLEDKVKHVNRITRVKATFS